MAQTAWHIRPLAVRSRLDLAAWGAPEPGLVPFPCRFVLIGTGERQALPAEAVARIAEAAREVGVWLLPGPHGLVLGASDDRLMGLARRLEDSPLGCLGPRLRAVVAALSRPATQWRTHRGVIDLGRPQVMGILNVTADSFYAGSRVPTVDAAVERAHQMVEAGADLLDIGGESTRPGAAPVSAAEETARVLPVVERLARELTVPLSVDTSKAEVAQATLDAGAWIINDVWGLRADPALAEVAARAGCGLVLMHSRGDSTTMSGRADYASLIGEISDELAATLASATSAGIAPEGIVLDPGVGFAKLGADNLRVLRYLPELLGLGRPLLVGASRKSFLGQCFGWDQPDRLEGSLAAAAGALQGGARVLRVHDVRETRRIVDVLHAAGTIDPGELPFPLGEVA